MKVSTRLMLGFGVLCLFILGLGVFSLTTMGNINVTTKKIIDNWMPDVSKAYQIKTEANRIYQLQGKLILDIKNTSLEEEIAQRKITLKSLVEEYLAQSISARGKDAASRFFVDYEGAESNDSQIVEQAKSGNVKGATLLYEGVAARLFEDIDQGLNELIAISEAEANEAGQLNQKQYDRQYQIILVAMGIIVLLGIGLSLWTVRSILFPIRTINKILENLAGSQGDLTQRISIQSGDEIEIMARNMNQVLETVEGMVLHIRGSTMEVAVSSMRIEDNCSQLTHSTEEISLAIAGLSEMSTEQAEMTLSARQLLQTYLSTLGEMADKAQETYELAKDAQENTDEGNEQMVALLGQMRVITEQNDAANRSLAHFQSMLDRVGQVNRFINTISEQTNILSLNAGIEAARAGAQGKGFGVIADEVRKLAQVTKESAQSIIGLLDGVQDEVNALSGQFQQNTLNIREGSRQIRHLTDTFQGIKETNGRVMENGALTKGGAHEMLSSAEQIADVFEQIGGLSAEQAASSQQISASIQDQLGNTNDIESFTKELSKQSDQLKKLVEKFHVTGGTV
ncbi:methyl-accepting chemotaxis protein [Cohnella terricola]|nr:methyl-accepting chemotaxis protein [Cohnella terricola]